jgi:hypothetical protein
LALKQADAEVLKQNMPPQNPKLQTQHPKPPPQTDNAQASLPTATVRTLALDLRQPLGLKANESNLVVTGVDYKSLAYVAGIKPGDRIFKVGDMQVSNVPEIKLAIATFQGRGDQRAIVYVDVDVANQISMSTVRKRTESDISDGYETNDSDSTIIVTEDNDSEDDGIDLRPNSARDLVWAKHLTSPWWPARLGEPNPEHLQIKPAGESSLFVVFFGSRPSCAWVPEQNVKPFIVERAAYAPRCKTTAFLLSLKEADAEAQKQAALSPGRNKKKQKGAGRVLETENAKDNEDDSSAAAGDASTTKRQRGPDAAPPTPPTPKYIPRPSLQLSAVSSPELTSLTTTGTASVAKASKTAAKTAAGELRGTSFSSPSMESTSNSAVASQGRSLSLLLSPLHHAGAHTAAPAGGSGHALTADALARLPAGLPSNATVEALRGTDSSVRWLSAPWTGLWVRSGGGPGSA